MAALVDESNAPTLASIEKLLKAKMKKIEGTDTNGKTYKSIQSLWRFIFPELKVPAKKKAKVEHITDPQSSDWYNNASQFWEKEENCPITDDGVLGGYGALTEMDVRGSNLFLDKLKTMDPDLQFQHAADCGAGIGRVTKHFLLTRFAKVDMIEQSPRLLNSAAGYIGLSAEETTARLTFIQDGLQTFTPTQTTTGLYDVIWIQWVIGHLHDLDFIKFFQRCSQGIHPDHGLIILKDNTILAPADHAFNLDVQDHSVNRHTVYMELLFELAGLELILKEQQADFPAEIYPVMMYALKPKKVAVVV